MPKIEPIDVLKAQVAACDQAKKELDDAFFHLAFCVPTVLLEKACDKLNICELEMENSRLRLDVVRLSKFEPVAVPVPAKKRRPVKEKVLA